MTGLIPSDRNQGGVRPPWFTAGLASVMLALFVAFGPQPDLFMYDRAGIEAGEWWRLLTGHLVHADMAHLAANVLALVLLGIVAALPFALPATSNPPGIVAALLYALPTTSSPYIGLDFHVQAWTDPPSLRALATRELCAHTTASGGTNQLALPLRLRHNRAHSPPRPP